MDPVSSSLRRPSVRPGFASTFSNFPGKVSLAKLDTVEKRKCDELSSEQPSRNREKLFQALDVVSVENADAETKVGFLEELGKGRVFPLGARRASGRGRI